jgi:hypothetical protein
MMATDSSSPISPLQKGSVDETIHGLYNRDGGIRTMQCEPVDMTWSEAVAALAVMGIIGFLLLL